MHSKYNVYLHHIILLVLERGVIKSVCTMQTTQLPRLAMGGLYYRFERARRDLVFIVFAIKNQT